MQRRTQIEPLQVTIEHAATLLGYSRATMFRLLAEGQIKSVGTGRLRRVAVAELRRWQEVSASE